MSDLQFIMKTYNVSVAELSDKLGVTKGNVYNWYNGKRKIPFNYINQMCDLFGLPEDYFKKELTPEDKLVVQRGALSKSIDETSFNYEDTIIGGNGNETTGVFQYVDNNLVNEINRTNEELYAIRQKTRIVQKITELLDNEECGEKLLNIYTVLIEVIQDKNVPSLVLKDILRATGISYDMLECSEEESKFIQDLTKVIKENEIQRQKRRQEIEKMIKDEKLGDLFS